MYVSGGLALLPTVVWDHLSEGNRKREIPGSDLYWEELDKKDVSLTRYPWWYITLEIALAAQNSSPGADPAPKEEEETALSLQAVDQKQEEKGRGWSEHTQTYLPPH